MKNREHFIQQILDSTNDELLLKFWRQKLEQLKASSREPAISVVTRKEEMTILED